MSKAQSGPWGRNRTNCTPSAVSATNKVKRRRPRRESGVVFGSVIMKNEKMRSVPLSS